MNCFWSLITRVVWGVSLVSWGCALVACNDEPVGDQDQEKDASVQDALGDEKVDGKAQEDTTSDTQNADWGNEPITPEERDSEGSNPEAWQDTETTGDEITSEAREETTSGEETAPIKKCVFSGQRLRFSYLTPGPDHIRDIDYVQDANDDGIPDIAVATDGINLPADQGYLILLSGAALDDAQVLWAVRPMTDRGVDHPCDTQECLSRTGDLNHDGVEDLLFGTAGDNRSAFAISGVDGKNLWYFDTHTEPESGWINSIHSFKDVTGDSVPEALFTVGSNTNRGFLADGVTGAILWRYIELADPLIPAAMIEDVNNDGYPDAVFGTGSSSGGESSFTVALVSGIVDESNPFAMTLWQTKTNNVNWSLAVLQDVNQDGKQDIAVAVWDGTVRVLSGHNGQEIWNQDFGSSSPFVMRMDDVDGDLIDDVAAVPYSGGVFMLSGKDGQILWKAETGDFCWTLDRIDDLDGDGVNDLVSGSADTLVRVHSGRGGGLLWEFDTGDERAMVVRNIPDVTGDGSPDVVAGTQYRGSGSGGGTVFLLDGCPP